MSPSFAPHNFANRTTVDTKQLCQLSAGLTSGVSVTDSIYLLFGQLAIVMLLTTWHCLWMIGHSVSPSAFLGHVGGVIRVTAQKQVRRVAAVVDVTGVANKLLTRIGLMMKGVGHSIRSQFPTLGWSFNREPTVARVPREAALPKPALIGASFADFRPKPANVRGRENRENWLRGAHGPRILPHFAMEGAT